MTDFLKGNFKVKRPVQEIPEGKGTGPDSFKEDYRKKALGSVGGSMVFVEMDKLMWDGESQDPA